MLRCLPLSIDVAVLRYRLWNIDIILNKALVDGLLTDLLTMLASLSGWSALVEALTGPPSQQPVALAISTLVIAALFQSLRHRLQHIIDHRFSRRPYDAEKTLAAFSAPRWFWQR